MGLIGLFPVDYTVPVVLAIFLPIVSNINLCLWLRIFPNTLI